MIWFCYGCVTEKQRLRICQGCTLKETIKDSLGKPEVKISWEDSVRIIRAKPGPTRSFSNCDSLYAELNKKGGTIVADSNGVLGTITLAPNKKSISFRCDVEAFKDTIRQLRKEITTNHYQTITKEVPARCGQEHLSRWDSFWIIMGRMLSAIAVVAIAFMFIRKKL